MLSPLIRHFFLKYLPMIQENFKLLSLRDRSQLLFCWCLLFCVNLHQDLHHDLDMLCHFSFTPKLYVSFSKHIKWFWIRSQNAFHQIVIIYYRSHYVGRGDVISVIYALFSKLSSFFFFKKLSFPALGFHYYCNHHHHLTVLLLQFLL